MRKMPIQVLINLFIAFLWMFLQDEWSFLSFFSGYLVGLVVLFMLRRFMPTSFYFAKFIAIIKLLYVFIGELITSSILVIRQVLRPKIDITPGIVTLKTDLEGDLEVTLLALLLTLTPGSVVMEVSPNGKVFYIHAMDIPESSDSVYKAQEKFEKAIKGVTRT
jgi:multicomponent Na+:H+ antiporter subunit E